LVKRYKTLNSNNNFHDILSEIFKVIIPDGKGIELNASGYAYGLGGPMPTKDILQLYKDHGGEILTIGSDEHAGRHVGHNFSKIIIPDGKGIELNDYGYAYGLGGPMPKKDIIQLYKDHGGEILTIGSDAHEGRHVGHNFSKIIDLIDSVGFKYITTFDNMKPTFHPLNSLKR